MTVACVARRVVDKTVAARVRLHSSRRLGPLCSTSTSPRTCLSRVLRCGYYFYSLLRANGSYDIIPLPPALPASAVFVLALSAGAERGIVSRQVISHTL